MATSSDDAEQRTLLLAHVRRFAEAVEHLQHDWAATTGLHRSDLAALTHLAGADDDLTMRQLADRLGLSPAATTALVDRLEGRGHARRGRHPDDARRVTVALSDEAAALAGRYFGELAGRVLAVLERFDGDELEVLERFLTALPGAVAPELDADDRRG